MSQNKIKNKNQGRSNWYVTCLAKNVSSKITVTDIKDVYRVQGKNDNISNTPIVVETNFILLKADVLKKSKPFNVQHKAKLCAKHLGFGTDVDTPIFISEQLTSKGCRLHFLHETLLHVNRNRKPTNLVGLHTVKYTCVKTKIPLLLQSLLNFKSNNLCNRD